MRRASLFAAALVACASPTTKREAPPREAAPRSATSAETISVDVARMVLVPAGSFSMGHVTAMPGMYGEEWKSNELPQHRVTLRAFHVDRDEVTVAEWARFVSARGEDVVRWLDPHQPITREGGALRARPGTEDLPITFVSWLDAYAYCAIAGKALPTEAEWERAARGPTEDRRFPWGNDGPTCAKAVFMPGTRCEIAPAKVGSRSPAGDSREGVHDLAGNVAEWIADWYAPYEGGGPVADPTGPESGTERVIRGGSVVDPSAAIRTTTRSGAAPFNRAESVGFRCVYRH